MTKPLKTILILIIIIILIIIALFIWPKLINNGDVDTEDGVSEIDTSDWVTYRNEEYGFEVKYQFKVEDLKKQVPPIDNLLKQLKIDYFIFGIYDNKDGLTAKEWIDQQYISYSGGWYGEYKNDKINNIEILRTIYDNRSGDVEIDRCYRERAIFPQENKLYVLYSGDLCYPDNNPEKWTDYDKRIDLFNDIVSSFKFID